MSLFKKILSLHRGNIHEEDSLTEIFASILRQDNAITHDFLELIGIEKPIITQVDTQVFYQKLEGHSLDSRPDLVIKAGFDSGKYDIVFIESKVRSYEHNDQLIRYADQLTQRHEDAQNRYLVYLTRSFDPKDGNEIERKTKFKVQFKPLLWSSLYTLLKEYQEDLLVREMIAFLEENGMSENTSLTALDLSAFASFVKLYGFMEKTLDGLVAEKFKKILGIKPEKIFSPTNLECGRIMLWNFLNQGKDWAIGIGFDLGLSGQQHPKLQVFLEINPDSSLWNIIAHDFKLVSEIPIIGSIPWELVNYNNPADWTLIRLETYLSSIVPLENHLEAAEEKLLWYLDQVEKVKKTFPNLPWI